MPSRTFLSREEKFAFAFEAAKDRITLLLCANISGDSMVKPILLYHAMNPRALKGKNQHRWPMFLAS